VLASHGKKAAAFFLLLASAAMDWLKGFVPSSSRASSSSSQPPPAPPPPAPPPPTRQLSDSQRESYQILLAAATADESGDSTKALDLYEKGCRRLMESIKDTDSEERKDSIRRTLLEALDRAEQLKGRTQQPRQQPPAQPRQQPAAPSTWSQRPSSAGVNAALAQAKAQVDAERRASLNAQREAEAARRAEQARRAAAHGGRGSSGRGSASGNAAASSSRGSVGRGASADGNGRSGGGDLQSKLEDGAIQTERPNVRWDDVAGLEPAKAALREAVVLPLRFPSLFTGERKPWKGILLYGPPGTGKSHLAKAVATEVEATFFAISSSDLVSKWVGDSEKLVRALFDSATQRKPSIIFIDEVDALCSNRSDTDSEASRRLKNELLVRMSAAEDGVLVLGATNLPFALDPAVRRRFERRILIPLPDEAARSALLRIHLGQTPHTLSADEIAAVARRCEGLSGADVSVLVRDALMEPVRELQTATHFARDADGNWAPCAPNARGAKAMSLMEVPATALKTPKTIAAHFERALRAVRPTVGADDLRRHTEFEREFGAG
jgi:vacuolar protein-sorting-associated protein 4